MLYKRWHRFGRNIPCICRFAFQGTDWALYIQFNAGCEHTCRIGQHRETFFFLEPARELYVVVLIGRKNGPITMPNPRVSSLLQSRQLKKEDNHTLLATAHHYGSSSPNAFAPTIFHRVACSAISCRTSWMSGWQPSKTQRLRSFQID